MAVNVSLVAAGNYTLEDNGIVGDNTSVIKDGLGNVVTTFVHPADAVNITVTTPGINLTVNLTDSLGTANLTIGDLANAAASPDSVSVRNVETSGTVTIVATGAITEGGIDAAADIRAGAVVLSAGAGVGTAGNAIETQTAAIEAETATGGINLANFGNVQIGGLSDGVNGLEVLTSGNLSFTNYGTVMLGDSTGFQTVKGGSASGNVTLLAKGLDADIIANTGSDSVTAAGGNIVLQAGRDILFGTIGLNSDNDVRARGSVTVNAGRDFVIDGFSDLASDDFGAGTDANVAIAAGRDIRVSDAAGSDATVVASGNAGADLILTTGVGGSLVIDAPFQNAVQSVSGNVVLNTDRLLLAADSGVTASAGQVFLRTATAGREVALGSVTDAASALEISDAEADRIFTPTLVIGTVSTGAIRGIGAFGPANLQNLTLASGSDIVLASALTVLQTLAVRTGNNFHVLAGSATTATTLNAIVDVFANNGGLGGIASFGGAITLTSSTILGNGDADTLNGTGGADLINGNGGNDIINGGGGIDTINGGQGNDILHGGGNGTDEIVHGNDGNDTLTSTGEGQYFGDTGNDRIFAGDSNGAVMEILDGGADIDTLDTTHFNGTYVIDMVTGVTNFAFESFVNFENLIAGGGNDTLSGTGGANNIQSGAGADVVNGRQGNDTLDGGAGDDNLIGAAGRDFLTGGADRDRFVFRDGDMAATRALADVITDFDQGLDERIRLSQVDANEGVGGIQSLKFIGTNAFSGAAGELRYIQLAGNTYLEGNTDTDLIADFVIRLNGLYTMDITDFLGVTL